MSNNPLSQYFRRPAIHIRLPSNGVGYPAGSLEIPETGELPVYSMTAVDEITYRTPDALFNGSAVTDVISSCIPGIKNPWAMPVADLDTVLIAIRIASYGADMEFETDCPGCNQTNNYSLDLRTVLDQMTSPDYSKKFTLGNLTITFRSLSYADINRNNMAQFEQQKMLSVIDDSNLPEEEKLTRLSDALKSLTSNTMATIAQSIQSIQTEETVVTETAHILEFLHNCDRKTYNKINDLLLSVRENSQLKPLTITCADCDKQYEQPFTMDMANFFGDAS